MSTGRRLTTLGIVPALMLAGIGLPMILHWESIPNPLAVHWDLTGTPDGSLPPIALVLGMAVIFGLIWFSVRAAVARAPREGASFVAGLWFFGGLMVPIMWLTVLANLDSSDWTSADEFTLVHLLVVAGTGIVLGVAGWVSAGGRSAAAPAAPDEGPALAVSPGERVVWSGRGRGWLTTLAGLTVVVVGLIRWSWVSAVLVVVGLIVLVFAEVRITIGPEGAVVGLGWLGVPSWRIPLETIEAGAVEQVFPMSYGGWGYRGRPGVRAIIVRGGEGIRLHRRGKPDLIVTVDGAATGAALINSLVRAG